MTPYLIFFGSAFLVCCAIVVHAFFKAPLIEDDCEPSDEFALDDRVGNAQSSGHGLTTGLLATHLSGTHKNLAGR